MKKSEVAMIILIASVSMLVAYFVAKTVIGDISNQSAKVKTATPIDSNVSDVDKTVFNKDAINPTIQVYIGSESDKTTDTAKSKN